MFTVKSMNAVRKYINTNENYKKHVRKLVSMDAAGSEHDDDSEGQVTKYFTLNNTGNIMISSTVKEEIDISKEVKEVFQMISVFFGAWTGALSKKGKTLHDADAISAMIEKSGFFSCVDREDRSFSYTSNMGMIDLALVNDVLIGLSAMGGALRIAEKVIGAFGKELKICSEKREENKKVAHILFVCENLMGMPIVTIMIFHTTSKESYSSSRSNCHAASASNFNLTYRQDTYMFVNPDDIKKYSGKFTQSQQYKSLIDTLAGYIP